MGPTGNAQPQASFLYQYCFVGAWEPGNPRTASVFLFELISGWNLICVAGFIHVLDRLAVARAMFLLECLEWCDFAVQEKAL